MPVTYRVLIVIVTLHALWVGGGAVAEGADKVHFTGEASSIEGSVERTRQLEGGSPARNGKGARIVSTAPPAPVVTRTRKFILYDFSNSGGGELRYVFDPRQDHCDSGTTVMTCYGPRPPRPPRGPHPPAPPPVTPQEIVERTLVNARLPSPRPAIDPGYAVTGMRAYLETGDGRTHRFNPIPTVLGRLTITATSTYTVDWGDGTVTGPHSNTGGEYPDGTITHVYSDVDVLDVTVTQHWTARWSLAGQSGTVGGLRSDGTIEDFVVREVQAVRTR